MFEQNNFFRLQEAPFATGQVLLREAGIHYAIQFLNLVAQRLKYAAQLRAKPAVFKALDLS